MNDTAVDDETTNVKMGSNCQTTADASTVSTSSSCDGGDNDNDNDDNFDQDMPLFKYARLVGSLPRTPTTNDDTSSSNINNAAAFSSPCTCCSMGKVILTPDSVVVAGGKQHFTYPSSDGGGGTAHQSSSHGRQSDLVWKYPHHVLAMGFDNGLLSIVDARTGIAICKPKQLKEYTVSPIVAVSFDASGAHLAALYANGMCTVWELRYAAARPTMSTTTTATATAGASAPTGSSPADTATTVSRQASSNAFTSFLTGFKSNPSPSTMSDSSHHHDQQNQHDASSSRSTIPSIKATSVQATRVPYPSSFGRPTCMAIDPAYKRNREKVLLVGFVDGRLVMTKRGFLMRRNDYPIYQGSNGAIETIEWRGHLAAWADESGIKLFDTDTVTRIAHVDRPSGARAALYPTISALRPTLCFETSESLLCAWGDCFMTLSIKERLVSSRNISSTSQQSEDGTAGDGETRTSSQHSQETQVVKRLTVECTVAWELDCVACGVVPLDSDHVAVLGLVPIMDDDEDDDPHNVSSNDLELQVMSRQQGTVIYADALPLIQSWNHNGKDDASRFSLLSSFALPRMDDTIEVREEKLVNADDADDQDLDFQMPLFSSSKSEPFKDTHTKWSLKQLSFEDDVGESQHRQAETDSTRGEDDAAHDDDDDDVNDTESVDSDDYSFVLRPLKSDRVESAPFSSTFPPLMVVVSPSDAVVASTREVDDAVSHALSAKKYGLALMRALTHKRQIREYDIDGLIDEYLRAVLRMNDSSREAQRKDVEDVVPSLSIRRVILAAQAMPMLLGGKVQMWERWITEFSKIPGGLFVLRERLPVRDPVLPAAVYEAVLQTMLYEIEEVLTNKAETETNAEGVLTTAVFPQMMGHFLSTLVAWGPTRFLREKIRLYKYIEQRKRKEDPSVETLHEALLMDVEKSLERRLHQTSSGYLQLPSESTEPDGGHDLPSRAANPAVDDTSDSLFSVDTILSKVSVHVPLFASSIPESSEVDIANNQAALEAMGELYAMKGKYKMALRCFLAIGCLHISPDVSSVEENAILSVNGSKRQITAPKYGFVLAMIEYQHLHQCLLDESFFSSSPGGEARRFSTPLVSLMQLVGLEAVGDFLVEHCAPPPVTKLPNIPLHPQTVDLQETRNQRQNGGHALPINQVADQLRPYPRLLHWYLHQIFVNKAELYVKFPRTAVPTRPVTELHRSHLELHIQFTDKRDSAKALSGVETYNLEQTTTLLLSFLKAALPLGGIRPDEARRLLEAERTGNKQGLQSDVVKYPHHFALELAYIVEHFGKDTDEEAKQILDLYLNGCKSLMLAVSYAQRNTSYSSQLWAVLIDYCLTNAQDDDGDKSDKDGSLFGSLLECAALSGADNLAHLVTQIPQGMNVEGLRPRLVAAVADYRWKLKMHEAASSIGTNERVVLLREVAHRSRRATRMSQEATNDEGKGSFSTQPFPSLATAATITSDNEMEPESTPTSLPRPLERPNRYRLSFAVPIR